jgi:hypothetical protein
MRSLVKTAALAGVAMLTLSAANAASTLIPVPQFKGGSTTNPFGINNKNVIAGSYLDSGGLQHGFYGSLKGKYTSFDYTLQTDVIATQARALNDDGDITGYATASSQAVGYEWELSGGTMFTITSKKLPSLDGLAQQITNKGEFVGSYQTTKGGPFAYIGQTWALKKTLKQQFGGLTMAGRGINKAGDIVGWFQDANGVQRGFTDIGGTFTQVDYPGNQAVTVLEGINDSGLIVGQYTDSSSVIHSFELSKAGKFKEIKVPNAVSFTQAFGVNNAGWVTILSDQGSFIYCPGTAAQCKAAGANAGFEVADGRTFNRPNGSFTVFVPSKKTVGAAKLAPLPHGAAAQ